MKKIVYLALLIVMTLSISMPVMAKTDKCGKDGCWNDNEKNGTIYCDIHAAQYARKEGYKVCSYSGCYASGTKKSNYCSKHTCKTNKCYNKIISMDNRYCTSHDPTKKKSTTTTKKYTTKTSKTSKTSKSSSKKKSSLERYDEGYEDVYENEDYDWDRYWSDDEYADGVDDAMDELDW